MTLLEVLFALGILGIVLAMFMTSFVSTLKQDASSGQRTQAVRVLDYLGRLVVNNDSRLVSNSAGGGAGGSASGGSASGGSGPGNGLGNGLGIGLGNGLGIGLGGSASGGSESGGSGAGGAAPSTIWHYGELGSTFQELSESGNGFGNPENYRATVLPLQQLSITSTGSVTMIHYQIEVCWETTERESCVTADTLAPPLTSNGLRPAVSW